MMVIVLGGGPTIGLLSGDAGRSAPGESTILLPERLWGVFLVETVLDGGPGTEQYSGDSKLFLWAFHYDDPFRPIGS